jgi:hypothetical protein
MLKRYLWIIFIISIFNSCKKNRESKELLEIILRVVGIPQENIFNICQTSIKSDICKSNNILKENQKLEKVKKIGDGKFLLETDNPCKPILLELQDRDILNGEKLRLKFSGVSMGTKQKELSILDAMVDATYLQNNLYKIKNLNNQYAQDKFYSILYRRLKDNINILMEIGLNLTQSTKGTLKYIADTLIKKDIYQKLPDKIDSCNDNRVCIDKILKNISDEILIDKNSAKEIYQIEINDKSPLLVKEVLCKEEPYWILPNKITKDTIGDIDANTNKIVPPFIDILDVNLTIDNQNIKIDINLLKYSILIDNKESRDYSVQFYIEDKNNLEIGLWLDNFDGLYREFYIIKDGENIFIENENIKKYVNIEKNSIRFNIPKTLNSEILEKITPSTKVHFWSRYSIEEKEELKDSYPNIYEIE